MAAHPGGRRARPARGPEDPNWRRHGRRIARRIGCFVGLALLVVLSAIFGVVWLVLSAFGVVSSAPFDTALAVTALVLGGVAVLVALLVLRRLAAPVGALIEGAHRIEAGDLSARVPVRGPADLRSLARAMNEMSGRLEAEETRRRSVLADIAHELRTPLSIIRGQAEAIADGIYPADAEHMAPIVSATESLEMLVDDLGTLTLAESGALRLHREPIDVAVLVNETLHAFGAEARRGRGAAQRAGRRQPSGDGRRPREDPRSSGQSRPQRAGARAPRRHHPGRGGCFRRVDTRSPSATTVRVFPADLLPRVFDRFVKGPSSTGSGLGTRDRSGRRRGARRLGERDEHGGGGHGDHAAPARGGAAVM